MHEVEEAGLAAGQFFRLVHNLLAERLQCVRSGVFGEPDPCTQQLLYAPRFCDVAADAEYAALFAVRTIERGLECVEE